MWVIEAIGYDGGIEFIGTLGEGSRTDDPELARKFSLPADAEVWVTRWASRYAAVFRVVPLESVALAAGV